VACAAAVATIRAIRDEGMLENAATRGAQLMAGLGQLREEHERIGDVRGLGLMVGVEFTAMDGSPDKPTAKAVVHHCLDDGLLLLTCGPWDNTVRFIPPLMVGPEEVRKGLEVFGRALRQAKA
jgi:4-aminobutyrate aminotransferase